MQNIIKKDKSLPAILNGIRQAVANAENPPKTKREIRNEELARKREAAQHLVDGGMTADDAAKALGVSRWFIYNHTTISEEAKHQHYKERAIKARAVYLAALEARKAYYVPVMMKLRTQGYTNVEIAQKTGFCYTTVLRYIGDQPDELSLMSMRVAGAKRRLRRKAIENNVAREQAVHAETSNIIPLAGD